MTCLGAVCRYHHTDSPNGGDKIREDFIFLFLYLERSGLRPIFRKHDTIGFADVLSRLA
jgi:hypothetical protein